MGHTGNADTLLNGKWSLTLPVGGANMTLPGDFSGILAPTPAGASATRQSDSRQLLLLGSGMSGMSTVRSPRSPCGLTRQAQLVMK